MHTPLEDIYSQIVTAFESYEKVSWIDIDIGQMEHESGETTVLYPAVLLKFTDVMWTDTSAHIQQGTAIVNVKVIFKLAVEADNYKAKNIRQEIKVYLEILADIHDKIDHVRFETFTKLQRFNQFQLKTKRPFLHWEHVMQYRCNFFTDGKVSDEETVSIDYESIRNDNDFMNRNRFNLLSK